MNNRDRRRLATVAMLCLWGSSCFAATAAAQVRIGPKGVMLVRRKSAESTRKAHFLPALNQPRVFRITIDPAAEPVPALKHVLLPRYENIKPGNGVPYYYRALLAMQTKPSGRLKEFYKDENYDRWMNGPLSKMPKEEVRKFLKKFSGTFRELQTATHREKCDWGWRLRDVKGVNAILFLLPEIQEARGMARLLVLRIRLAIAEGRYKDALQSFQLGFKLARDVAEPPTLINDLVGIAICHMLTVEIRHLIASPDAPNLYWALSALPSPFIDLRPALDYEMALPMKMFPAMKDAETARRTPAEWATLLTKDFRNMQRIEGTSKYGTLESEPNFMAQLTVTALILKGYPRAKRELVAWGFERRKLEAMPVGQVVAIHQLRVYRYMSQEMMKWSRLPFREAHAGLLKSERKLKDEGFFAPIGRSREIIPITSLLLPPTLLAHQAVARIDVRMAGMRVLEAIRIHAAQNHGRLPESLSEIKAVPVPRNPTNGKLYPYRISSGKAILDIPAPRGAPVNNSWRLIISMRPKKK